MKIGKCVADLPEKGGLFMKKCICLLMVFMIIFTLFDQVHAVASDKADLVAHEDAAAKVFSTATMEDAHNTMLD